MKISLVVMDGAHKGKEIPIKGPEFVIGRDPQCQLRPASPMISRKHCAVVEREGKIFLHDFGSTNGTHVNGQRVNGEVELHNEDRIKVDPLDFQIKMVGSAAGKPTPPPPTRVAAAAGDDDSIAAMLLELQDDSSSSANPDADPAEVPLGDTVMQMPSMPDTEADTKVAKPKKAEEKKVEQANTSAAAKMLLDKYTRRKRP
jgi:pSer/pThr/pTyr-binding forkhead associated (FHA) protein